MEGNKPLRVNRVNKRKRVMVSVENILIVTVSK